ncbi:GAF domain-containing protein [Desulfovibrio sp. JC010]|uniref:GAF domain-containing protein n=1 Tax=Desulfovibrio sp. JC010 TaxID=2593641 RepID=UPI0013D7F0FB|nr:GAF domain-containing protein [Desulfovibrio sp. JC010]
MRDEAMKAYAAMPFTAELSFEPLFRKARSVLSGAGNPYSRQIGKILDSLEGKEGLSGAVTAEDLQKYAEEIHFLMRLVFPDLEDKECIGKVQAPFTHDHFFATARYREMFEEPGIELELSESLMMRLSDLYSENLLFAYTMLFDIYYQLDHEMIEVIMKMPDPQQKVDRYFLADYSFRFVDVDAGGLDILPREQFSRLLIMRDKETLERLMPLDGVSFKGLITVSFSEVTEKENISQLKSDLVENGSLRKAESLAAITHRLRSILKVEDLRVGLVLRYRVTQGNRETIQRSVLRDYPGETLGLFEEIYDQVFRTAEPYFIPEILECEGQNGVVDYLYRSGARSMGLMPLMEEDRVIAVLELVSDTKDMISTHSARKLAELLPILSVAVRREMNRLESRVDRVIKEHCTAIHPSVAWRFEEAAYNFLSRNGEDGEVRFNDIVFRDVYPLYGSMDIRSSSVERNQAIQADLLKQLDLASQTLSEIYRNRTIPIADYYFATLARYAAAVREGLNSGDEINIIEFLQQRVEPFFNYLRETSEKYSSKIDEYFKEMNPGMGVIYQRRRDYEDSVSLLNLSLTAFLDQEEVRAQQIFPHYFEKYRTDGVEYNIYVGESMVRDFKFDDVQLRNLRVWQMIKMCEMVRLTDSLLPQLRVPLSCSPLVLVHSAPLTILFRVDEKRFEVEGTYNIRYEIIKKRIDKSTILGSGERLTRPGMLSVIYTQDKEWREYTSYFEYLADKGFIEGEIENHVLEDMQGVHGLRALRAKVVL